jgi:hypothetical protein
MVGCGEQGSTISTGETAVDDTGLVLAMAVLDEDGEGNPVPLPARLGILKRTSSGWSYSEVEDPDSNVYHLAMAYQPRPGDRGVLTAGGTSAVLKLWRPGQSPEVVWEASFGGRFSRMRDVAAADVDGDGDVELVVATHDQGVVALIDPTPDGWDVRRLDEAPSTFVHEVEIGDLDGDGAVEAYATPSHPNRLDGAPQPGSVVRYAPLPEPAQRAVVADLGDRHAKEILVTDLDGNGMDELYVVVEAVSGGRVEIRRFEADTPPEEGVAVAHLPDTQCRFLTPGDVDGDGHPEVVAAAYQSGLWLLEPTEPGRPWRLQSIARDSGGFEHAAVLADLDGDGRDELYVANDEAGAVDRYVWQDGQPQRTTIFEHPQGLDGFTWNIMPVPADLLPQRR